MSAVGSPRRFDLEATEDYGPLRDALERRGWSAYSGEKFVPAGDLKANGKPRQKAELVFRLDERGIDYGDLRSRTVVNHFPSVSKCLATKAGLTRTLRDELPWTGCAAQSEEFFPRSYILDDPDSRAEFVSDFKLTAASSILKSVGETFLKRHVDLACRACESWLDEQDNTLTPEEWEEVLLYAELLGETTSIKRLKAHADTDEEKHYAALTALRNCEQSACDDAREWCASLTARLALKLPQWRMDGRRNVWVVKAPEACRGKGIVLKSRLSDILKLAERFKGRVVQKYVEDVALFSEAKFDLRLWFLMTCGADGAVRGYFFEDCYARLCSKPYDLEDISDPLVHLTNLAVQKKSKKTLMKTKNELFERYPGAKETWRKKTQPGLEDILRALLATATQGADPRPRSFELLGVDVVLDAQWRPWLLEVNLSPALARRSETHARTIYTMLEGIAKRTVDSWFGKVGHWAPKKQFSEEEEEEDGWRLVGLERAPLPPKKSKPLPRDFGVEGVGFASFGALRRLDVKIAKIAALTRLRPWWSKALRCRRKHVQRRSRAAMLICRWLRLASQRRRETRDGAQRLIARVALQRLKRKRGAAAFLIKRYRASVRRWLRRQATRSAARAHRRHRERLEAAQKAEDCSSGSRLAAGAARLSAVLAAERAALAARGFRRLVQTSATRIQPVARGGLARCLSRRTSLTLRVAIIVQLLARRFMAKRRLLERRRALLIMQRSLRRIASRLAAFKVFSDRLAPLTRSFLARKRSMREQRAKAAAAAAEAASKAEAEAARLIEAARQAGEASKAEAARLLEAARQAEAASKADAASNEAARKAGEAARLLGSFARATSQRRRRRASEEFVIDDDDDCCPSTELLAADVTASSEEAARSLRPEEEIKEPPAFFEWVQPQPATPADVAPKPLMLPVAREEVKEPPAFFEWVQPATPSEWAQQPQPETPPPDVVWVQPQPETPPAEKPLLLLPAKFAWTPKVTPPLSIEAERASVKPCFSAERPAVKPCFSDDEEVLFAAELEKCRAEVLVGLEWPKRRARQRRKDAAVRTKQRQQQATSDRQQQATSDFIGRLGDHLTHKGTTRIKNDKKPTPSAASFHKSAAAIYGKERRKPSSLTTASSRRRQKGRLGGGANGDPLLEKKHHPDDDRHIDFSLGTF